MSPVLLLLAFGLLIFYFFKQAFSRPPNFPPGPPRLPIWGSYWFLLLNNYKFLHLAIQKLTKKYKSKVIGFYLGPFPTIVATDYDSVKELLSRPEFQGRPETILTKLRAMNQRLGIFFVDGPSWAEQRRFMLRHMRDFGFGRRFASLEEVMQEEVQDFLGLLHGDWTDKEICKGDIVHFPSAFYPYFINLLWSMMGGTRYGRIDYPLIRELCRGATLFVQSVDPLGGAISQTPWLQYIAPRATGLQGVLDGNQYVMDHMKKAITEHQTTYSDDHMRDFIDIYIREMKQRAGNEGPIEFKDDQLMLIGTDALLATATTVTGTMTFAFQGLCHYPEVQKNVQNELDKVIGRDRLPTLDDRSSLPYTEATLREVMRRFTMLPFGFPHLVTEDTYLQGYTIPKNTLIFASLWAIHMDPELWGDPEVFRPERFLDDNGLLKKKDITLPFGSGKRLCPGETFSRQSTFVLFAAMLQNFSFTAADPKALPALDDMHSGLAVSPIDFWVRVQPRA